MKPLQTLQDNPQLLRDILDRLEALEALVIEKNNGDPPTPPTEQGDKNTLRVTVCWTTSSSKEQSQKDTFLEAIHRIGIEDVKGLSLKGKTFLIPATDTEKVPEGYALSPCGKYFVYVNLSAKQKAEKLREISDKLSDKLSDNVGIKMTIKVVSADGTEREF